ncbi:MAG: glutathione S-transferase family protein [Polyangiaceae bacterium]
MYTLYHAPSTASMAPHILLRELGVPHELVLVDTDNGGQRTPEYLRLNPHARVPTLVDGDLVLYESAAICLHLCDRHPDAGLAPPFGSAARADFYKWMIYLTNTVQAEAMLYFYPERYTSEPHRDALKAVVAERLAEMFARIDPVLARRPYLLGDALSAADIYLFMVSRWTRNMPRKARELPHLGAFLARVMARRAVREAYAIEGIAEPYY